MTQQPLTNRIPVVNPDGTPTQYFIRLLQERGVTLDNKITIEEAEALIEEWSLDRDIIAGFGLDGGGNLGSDVTIDLNAGLSDLTDVDTAGATSGQVLGFDGTEWVPVDQTGGGGSDVPHLYWRLFINANNGSSAVAIGEIEMRATVGGADQCTGGTAAASSTNGPYVPANAFNNDGGATFWAANAETVAWISYAFPAEVHVKEVAITSRSDGFTGDAPKSYQVQYSDDNVNWNTLWGNNFASNWSVGETRTSSIPPTGGSGGGGSGTVTSVDVASDIPGISSSGGPVTSSGTITLDLTDSEALREAIGALSYYRYPVFGGSGPIEPIFGEDGESIYVELTNG